MRLEILFILIEFFGEFLLQVFISFFFEGAVELGGHSLKKARKKRHEGRVARAQAAGEPEPEEPEPFSWVVAVVIYGGLGLLSGVLSIEIFPHPFVKQHNARLVMLFLAPTAVGMMMSLIGRIRDRNGEEPIRLDNFCYGFLFAFMLNFVRYYLAA